MSKLACAVALACAGAGTLPAAEIGGRYASQPPADPVARFVEIMAHRHAYAVSYQAEGSRRKQHGWGLRDGDQLVVAPSTGGAAYGVAIYHHIASENVWTGPFISSLDGGASLGKIRFEGGASLEGRHAVVCERPGAGSVSGTVEIKPAGEGYQLTFNLGRAVSYRGVGLLLPGDRLAVGWSFGSAPEVAVYQVADSGALAEHRADWKAPGRGPTGAAEFKPISDEQYFTALNQANARGSASMPLFASPAAAGEVETAADAGDAGDATVGPAAPRVKAWNYDALLRQYGADGWAERWLDRQLTLEESRLLHAALRRRQNVQGSESQSIGTLIEEERARETGHR